MFTNVIDKIKEKYFIFNNFSPKILTFMR